MNKLIVITVSITSIVLSVIISSNYNKYEYFEETIDYQKVLDIIKSGLDQKWKIGRFNRTLKDNKISLKLKTKTLLKLSSLNAKNNLTIESLKSVLNESMKETFESGASECQQAFDKLVEYTDSYNEKVDEYETKLKAVETLRKQKLADLEKDYKSPDAYGPWRCPWVCEDDNIQYCSPCPSGYKFKEMEKSDDKDDTGIRYCGGDTAFNILDRRRSKCIKMTAAEYDMSKKLIESKYQLPQPPANQPVINYVCQDCRNIVDIDDSSDVDIGKLEQYQQCINQMSVEGSVTPAPSTTPTQPTTPTTPQTPTTPPTPTTITTEETNHNLLTIEDSKVTVVETSNKKYIIIGGIVGGVLLLAILLLIILV